MSDPRGGGAVKTKEKTKSFSDVSRDVQRLGKLSQDIGKSAEQLDSSIETEEQKKRRMVRIEKSLKRLSRNIEDKYLRLEIEEEIRIAAQRGDFKKVGERMKKTSDINEKPEVQAQIDELVLQQDKYGAVAAKIRGLKGIQGKMPQWMLDSIAAGGASMSAQEIIDKYYIQENGRYRAKTKAEMAWEAYEQADGFFGKGMAFLKAYVAGGMARRYTKQAEGAVNTGMEAKETVEELKEDYGGYVESAVETGEYAAEKAKEANEVRKDVQEELRKNPQALAAARAAREKATLKAKEFVSSKNKKLGEALDGVARKVVGSKDTQKAINKVGAAAQEVAGDIRKLPPLQQKAVAKQIEKGKLPGFKARGHGKMAVISVFSQGFHEALQKKDPRAFLDNIANSNIWLESIIPGVGTFKSMTRLFKDNGDSLGMKLTDLGINLAADVWTLWSVGAGCVGGFMAGGVGAIPGCAAGVAAAQGGRAAIAGAAKFLTRAGMKATARSMVKAGGKIAAKSTAKAAARTTATTTVKAGAKLAVKEGSEVAAREGAEIATKKVVTETTEELAKLGTREGGEQIAKSGMRKGAEWIGDTLWASGKYSGTMLLVQQGFENLFPTEKVKEMAVNVAMDQVNAQVDPYVTPGMRDLYSAISGDELPVGTPNSERDILA